MSHRVRLGAWRFPSGNHVDVYLEPDNGGPRIVSWEWDHAPPLRPHDARFYQLIVLPKVTRLLGEYLERPGPALVLQPEGWPGR